MPKFEPVREWKPGDGYPLPACAACRDGIRRELVWGTDDTYVHHYGDAPGTVVPCAYSDLPAEARPSGSQEGERTTGASKPSIGTAKPTDLASSSAGTTSTAAEGHDFTGRGPCCLVCGWSRLDHDDKQWQPRKGFDLWYFTKGPGASTGEAADGR